MIYDTQQYYQNVVDYLRRRHTIGGYPWPGKPVHSSAKTLYPNIAAELSNHLWLKDMADFAGVSPEIMAAVIEDGEKLTKEELWNLSRKWEGRGPGYLSAPVLQVVDPGTNKGKRRRWELADLLRTAKGLPVPVETARGRPALWVRRAYAVYDMLEDGNVVSLADYWWACYAVRDAVRDALWDEALKAEAEDTRTERMATA